MRDADVAMYLAKHRGKGRVELFEAGMRQQVLERLELRVELVDALDRGELAIRYQPVVEIESDEIHGFEALLRWNHPTRGEIQPAQFISIAEECDLLIPIGRWVLEEACRQVHSWDPSPDGPEISVNVSPMQLGDASFASDVRRALDRSRLAPGRLQLEITESTLVANPVDAAEILGALRDLGVRVALDGFGSGHTSLDQLRMLPVDVVKFDRGFVTSSLSGNPNVLRGLIGFAHNLGIDTVGEGVETAGQLGQLASMGCQYVQGFVIARPLTAAAAQVLLHERTGFRNAPGDVLSPTR
jgi:EAL domain-containing protein (putative c-di-GMP-specific phosphodiesterase class I)